MLDYKKVGRSHLICERVDAVNEAMIALDAINS